MAARIFKRGRIWFAWVPVLGGGTRKVSTQCTDKKAAEAAAAVLERDAVDPDRAAATTATLREALELLIRDRLSKAKAGKMSHETVAFYQRKSGVLVDGIAAVLGRSPTATIYLREVTAALVDDYIIQRRDDGVEESTISKELVTWRSAMRLAKRRQLWAGDIEEVFPRGFSPEYQPGERFLAPYELPRLFRAMVRPVAHRSHGLTGDQVADLRARLDVGNREGMRRLGVDRKALAKEFGISTATLWKIDTHREPEVAEVRGEELFAIVAFAIATGAEPSAIWRARRGDAASDRSSCLVRGSKNKYRKDRPVALPLLPFRMLLEYAVTNADGDDVLFPSRHKSVFRRTLTEACVRAGIPHVTLTDLRRTHGKWLRLSGVSPANIGTSLGHADGRMAERIYGKASPLEIAAVLEAQIAASGGALPMGGSYPDRHGLLMGAELAETGSNAEVLDTPVSGSPVEISAETSGFSGAHSRNRTRDTGIFNPARSPEKHDGSEDSATARAANGQGRPRVSFRVRARRWLMREAA